MENVEKISIKKLLLCILCGIIIVIALGMITLFVVNIPLYIQAHALENIDKHSQEFKDYLNSMENSGIVTNFYSNAREDYGDDYPINGLFVHEISNSMRILKSNEIVNTFAYSLVIGVFFGSIVYIIMIQKARKVKLISEILLVIAVVYLIMLCINLGFYAITYNWENKGGVQLISYIYDYFDSRLLTSFAVILSGTVIVKLIREKIALKK